MVVPFLVHAYFQLCFVLLTVDVYLMCALFPLLYSLDVKMPVMSGVETYKKIKQIRPSAVIIFMTAFGLEDLANDMIGEGAYAVMEKPSDIDKVINMIEKSRGGGF